MNLQPHLNPDHPTSTLSKRIVGRVAIFALLFAVAGLATIAKKNWYAPRSNQAHYLSIANKAKVSVAQADLGSPQYQEPIAKVSMPDLVGHVNRREEDDIPPGPQIGVVVSLQHRSPPPAVA